MSTNLAHVAPPIRILSGQERAAAIIMAMGPETAQKVIKHLEPDLIRKISKAGSNLGTISTNQMNDIVDEFIESFTHGSDIIGSPAEVHKLLSGILPKEQLDGIMDELHGHANRSIWERISSVQDSTIATYLSKEHPQTAAVILSKINSTTAARVIEQLPVEIRNTVTNRMLSLKPLVDVTLKNVEAALQDNFLTNFSRDASSDTHARMAKIINKMPRETMELVLSEIAATKPKSAETLKSMLFTFDDIVKLTQNDRTLLVDCFAPEAIAAALIGANATIKECVLAGVSGRLRRIIENLIDTTQNATPKEISDARRAMTDMALDLAGKNKIVLPSGADDPGYY